MPSFLIATQAPVLRDEDTHPNLLDATTYNDGSQDWWCYLCSEDVTGQYPDSKLIGAWNDEGSIANQPPIDPDDPDEVPVPYPVDPDYADYIRQFGNGTQNIFDEEGNVIDTLDGVATDSLDFQHWFGDKQRQVQAGTEPELTVSSETPIVVNLLEYPVDNQPFILEIERRFEEGNPLGWGWVATIRFASDDQKPTARRVTEHNSDWSTKYSTGSFNWQDTGVPSGETEFVDTGQTVLGQQEVGDPEVAPPQFITEVEDKSAFNIGDDLRIEGIEGSVGGFWEEGEGIEISPAAEYTTGAAIEITQDINIYAWQTAPPPGRRTENPEDIYYSLTTQSEVNGRFVLPAGSERQQNYFWETNQDGTSVETPVEFVTHMSEQVTHEDDEVTYGGA